MGASWTRFGRSWRRLGGSWRHVGDAWSLLEVSWALQDPSGRPLGRGLESLLSLLEIQDGSKLGRFATPKLSLAAAVGPFCGGF